ncbi:MAG TPA: S8 family peptidase [Bacillales bacterium]|nr:S8 family peptidase [Bacillales bacterium]
MDHNEINLIPVTVEEVLQQPEEVIPYGVKMVNAPAVWDEAAGGKGNVIAVLDTGCQPDHPDLQARIAGGRNFTEDYNGEAGEYADNHFHGTHVAGTIAAVNNHIGVIGVAPKARLLILKVLDSRGKGSYKNIIQAIRYAVRWRGPNGERVRAISMSLGGPRDEPQLHEAIRQAVDEGILVVCAAGNSGDGKRKTNETEYPGAYKEVVQVGAVGLNRRLADFSNTNNEIDLVAPGINILSTFPGSRYARLSGTSMATPHVSGAAALIINLFEKKFERIPTERDIFAQLAKQTIPLGYSKKEEGNGLLFLTDGHTRTYEIKVQPLADGYVAQLGFNHEKRKMLKLAEQLQTDLSKIPDIRADIETYQFTRSDET